MTREELSNANRRRATKHGEASNRTDEYTIWAGMVSRCHWKGHSSYARYGGRGVVVCERWKSFENFLSDMGRRPSSLHSLDRYPNKDGNYEPGNVRWATNFDQGRNKRTNRIIEFRGKTQCLTDWAAELGISIPTLSARINRYGWTTEEALTRPVYKPRASEAAA